MSLFYKNDTHFNTKWGCIITCFVTVTYLTMVGLKLTEFFGETDPVAYFSDSRQSMDEPIELSELGFTFAVENVNRNIGRLEAA